MCGSCGRHIKKTQYTLAVPQTNQQLTPHVRESWPGDGGGIYVSLRRADQNSACGTRMVTKWAGYLSGSMIIALPAVNAHSCSMAEVTKNGVMVRIEIWVDHGKIIFSNVENDFGPKGMIGSFVAGSAAEKRAQELLERHGKLPQRT
jgi:hypothetical protein